MGGRAEPAVACIRAALAFSALATALTAAPPPAEAADWHPRRHHRRLEMEGQAPSQAVAVSSGGAAIAAILAV